MGISSSQVKDLDRWNKTHLKYFLLNIPISNSETMNILVIPLRVFMNFCILILDSLLKLSLKLLDTLPSMIIKCLVLCLVFSREK